MHSSKRTDGRDHEQYPGIVNQSGEERDTLLHAAGQLERKLVLETAESDLSQQLFGADYEVANRQAANLDLKQNVFERDRKSTRLNSSHQIISYAVFCLKKKKNNAVTNCGDAALPFCGMCPLQVCLAVG